jgi:hypothetical protein
MESRLMASKSPVERVEKAIRDARRSGAAAYKAAGQLELEFVRFKTGDQSIEFSVDLTAETVWATQGQIAELFERDKSTISEHIKNILSEKELDEEAVVGKFPTTGPDGKTYNRLRAQRSSLQVLLRSPSGQVPLRGHRQYSVGTYHRSR